MKKYKIRVMRRDSALTNDWYEVKPIFIEARTLGSACNKLDKLARKMNSDYRRVSAYPEEI